MRTDAGPVEGSRGFLGTIAPGEPGRAARRCSCWRGLAARRRLRPRCRSPIPRCEGLREAPQVDTTAPRFSWRLVATSATCVQTAYQLRVTEVDARGRPLGAPVESARVESDETQWVVVPGFAAQPRTTYAWQVRVWDNHGNASDWTEPRRFGTGLLGERWPADWIGDGRASRSSRRRRPVISAARSQLEHQPVRARLYVSALGLVEPWLNGGKVTEDLFVPGWPDYRRRVFYAAFDVTPMLRPGDNTLGMILGDGWYSGTMIPRHQYGQQAMVSAFLDLTDAKGSHHHHHRRGLALDRCRSDHDEFDLPRRDLRRAPRTGRLVATRARRPTGRLATGHACVRAGTRHRLHRAHVAAGAPDRDPRSPSPSTAAAPTSTSTISARTSPAGRACA